MEAIKILPMLESILIKSQEINWQMEETAKTIAKVDDFCQQFEAMTRDLCKLIGKDYDEECKKMGEELEKNNQV